MMIVFVFLFNNDEEKNGRVARKTYATQFEFKRV